MNKFMLVLLAVIIAAGAIVYTDPQLRRDAGDMFQRAIGTTGIEVNSVSVYKWKDAKGVLQYTQEPPPEGTPYEEVEARTDVNVLPLPEELKRKE